MVCLGLGRCMFLAVYILQMVLLAVYFRQLYYPAMAGLVLVLVPGLIAWLTLVIKSSARPINNIWIVWLLYQLGLLTSVGTIFSQDVERLDESVFGPDTLKLTLCLTPVLFLLLLSTKISASKNPKLIERLSIAITLHLFDENEMLGVLVHQYYQDVLGSLMKNLKLFYVLLIFLLSSVALYLNKFNFVRGEVQSRETVSKSYAIIKIIFINIVYHIFLGEYKFSVSIFITENLISIACCIIDILVICSYQKSNKTFVV